jgi:hypothetical protein
MMVRTNDGRDYSMHGDWEAEKRERETDRQTDTDRKNGCDPNIPFKGRSKSQ